MSRGSTRTWRNWRARPALKGVALVAAAVTAAAGGADAALAARPAHQLLPAGSKPGLGWSIAEYFAGSIPGEPHSFKGKITLYAVNPQGRKFAFHSWPASNFGPSAFHLVDWSGDGQRVLVQNFFNKFEQISPVTGKVINTFKLPPNVEALGYTRPDGLNILVLINGNEIGRYDLAGNRTKILLTHVNGQTIEAPNGQTVIVGTNSGIEQVSNLGGVVKRLHAPVAVFGCNPVRWWNESTVLASCNSKSGSGAPRLWLFPINGGKVTSLTAQRNTGPDLGDIDAWKLTSGVYSQALGPCGVVFIAKIGKNGSASTVKIPGVNYPSDLIITGHASSLLVQGVGGCSGGSALLWFNPGTHKVTSVLKPPKNVAGVMGVVPYGRPLA
jgi:hypothetical protein